MILHVIRRELAARWILLPAAIVIGALAMIAIHSIGHVRGDADGIMNGTWVGTLVVSTIVGMSLLGDELTNSRLSFYFARPFSPHTIFAGKLAAGVLVALVVQVSIMLLVALALPALSWRGSAFAHRDVLSIGGERVLATIGCTLLGMAASIALGSKTRWFVVDALGVMAVGVLGTWFALQLEPDPAWLPADSIRSVGEKALLHAAAFAVAVAGLCVATARALVRGRTDRMRAHRTLSTTLWPIVVPALVMVVFVGQQTAPSIPDPPALPNNVLVVPKVESATMLATEDADMPYLLLLDDTGKVRVGAAASWAKFDAKRVRLARPAPIGWETDEPVARFLKARYLDGMRGELGVASISVLDDEIEHWRAPAPPEPAPPWKRKAHAIKVAKQRTQEFVEQQTTELARAAGILGLAVDRQGPGFPHRLAMYPGMNGEWSGNMVLAPPTLSAKVLLNIVASTGAPVAVSSAGKIRPLRQNFFFTHYNGDCPATSWPNWVEARVSSSKIVVEAVPDTPIDVADIEDLVAAIDEARKARGIGACAAVDVLVDPDVDTQRFFDILTALDIAGVRTIGVGFMPGLRDLALRGHRIPSISTHWHVPNIPYWNVAGLDRERIVRCYREALADDPDLSGVMKVKSFVGSDGKVTSATASGVDPALMDCVVSVFSAVTFPKPNPQWMPRMPSPFEVEVEFRP